MILQPPEPYIFDKGRTVPEEERRELAKEYPWPRPERKLCRKEGNNDCYRLGRR